MIQTETDNKSWRVFSGTNPENADTDGDGLNDFDENATFGTNPLNADTDGDGLIDSNETIEGTNPLLADTDGDGLSDALEQSNALLNPLQVNSMVAISGAIYSQANYPGNFYLRVQQGTVDSNGLAVKLLKTMSLLYRKQIPFRKLINSPI